MARKERTRRVAASGSGTSRSGSGSSRSSSRELDPDLPEEAGERAQRGPRKRERGSLFLLSN